MELLLTSISWVLNRISRKSYISPHNFFQELLHKLATHLTTTTTENCTVMHSQQVWINAKYSIPHTTKGVNNY